MSDPVGEDPVYENPPPKYTAERILKILLDPSIEKSKICSKRPSSVTKSATYIINITKLADPEDVKSDYFGIWNHSGSHPNTYKVHVEQDRFISVEKCAAGASGVDVVYLRRLHSVYPFNNQFKHLIAFVSALCCLGDLHHISAPPKHTHTLSTVNLATHVLLFCVTTLITCKLSYTDAENNPHHLALVTYHIPSGFVPFVKSWKFKKWSSFPSNLGKHKKANQR